METIEIEGGIARVITKSITKQVPLAEFLKNIERVPPVILPSIGRTQVFAYWLETPADNRKKLFALCELPPATRSITKNVRRARPSGLRRYRLAMPWTYFYFTASTYDTNDVSTFDWSISESRVFFAKEKFRDINSPFIAASLPNLSSHGEVCWGSTSVSGRQSLADQLDQRVNNWYLSEFNDDLDGNVPLPYDEPNMGRWVRESAENPNSWQNWPDWNTRTSFTVKKLIDYEGIEIPTVERFTAGGFIPEIELPMTFGRWEEFWRSIPAEQRTRGFRALENMRADNPDDVPEEVAVSEPVTPAANDDGGVPVNG